MEKWIEITGYEGYYEVSNLGNVRTFDREITYKARGGGYRTDFLKSRKLKPQKHKNSYLSVTLYNKIREKKQFNIHRLVALMFIENPFGKLEVNHKDGNKLNNIVENLEWVTRSENAKHMVDNQMIKYITGSGNSNCVLSFLDAENIRTEYKNGSYSQDKLAKKYGCSQATISQIIRNITYKK